MSLARSTRLLILLKNIYTLSGRKHLRLSVTYSSKYLLYPFTRRETSIKIVMALESPLKAASLERKGDNHLDENYYKLPLNFWSLLAH